MWQNLSLSTLTLGIIKETVAKHIACTGLPQQAAG